MSIVKSDVITLNGANTGFGGIVYNADLQIGFNESPSILRLNFINRQGVYNISKENLRTTGAPDTIKLGSKTMLMYPIEYSINRGMDGKILTVEYHDASVLYLDKKYVLLNDYHLIGNINSPNNPVVSVGNKYQIYNVDVNPQTVIQNVQIENPNEDYLELGSTMYTPAELYSAMIDSGIPMHPSVGNILNQYPDYLNNISGSLRAVISAWSNLLAFSFYWDEDSKLHFIDLSSPIQINWDKIQEVTPINDEESYSLKNTFYKGFSLNYGQRGEIVGAIGTGGKTIRFNRAEVPSNPPINLIKAAILGSDMLTAYGVVSIIDSGNDSTDLGFEDVSELEETEISSILGSEKPEGNYRYFSYNVGEGNYSYGSLIDIAEAYCTYVSNSMTEKDMERYTNWTHPVSFEGEGVATIKLDRSEVWKVPSDSGNAAASERFVYIDLGTTKALTDQRLFRSGNTIVGIEAGTANSILSTVNSVELNSPASVSVRGVPVRPSTFLVPRQEQIRFESPNSGDVYSIEISTEEVDKKQLFLSNYSVDDLFEQLKISVDQSQPKESKVFTVTNIDLPEDIYIEDGLQSLTISLSDKGFQSTYSMGNERSRIVDKDILWQKLERHKAAYISRNMGPAIAMGPGASVRGGVARTGR